MPSVTPPTYNYQHDSSVTSQVTFPASSTLSSSDIFNTKCLQQAEMILKLKGETQVALNVTGQTWG